MCDGVKEGGGPREATLVKYDHPRLIASRSLIRPNPLLLPSSSKHSGKKKDELLKNSTNYEQSIHEICAEVLSQLHPDEVLGIILPPKEWTEDGKNWRQIVSSVPATKADVIDLFQKLDTRMKEGRAKETGICPTRRELYTQCFDELIRQVAIICEGRGLLLLRVRNELQMTMCSYESLYISATAYAMRRLLMNRLVRTELETQIELLTSEQVELMAAKRSYKKEMVKVIKENAVIEQREKESRALEMENLKKVNTELKRQKDAAMGFKKQRAVAKEDD